VPEARRKVIIATVSLLAIIVSVATIVRGMLPTKITYNKAPFIGIGQALADATDKTLNGYGDIVVLITKSHQEKGNAAHDEFKAFQDELKKNDNIRVLQLVELNENSLETGFWQSEFERLLNQYSQATAIVSLVGLPNLDPQHPLLLDRKSPKIIAIHQSMTPAKDYFTQSIATVLITTRGTPAANPQSVPQTPQEWFDKYYEVYTAKNYESIPN
jgi:hypothetical protein